MRGWEALRAAGCALIAAAAALLALACRAYRALGVKEALADLRGIARDPGVSAPRGKRVDDPARAGEGMPRGGPRTAAGQGARGVGAPRPSLVMGEETGGGAHCAGNAKPEGGLARSGFELTHREAWAARPGAMGDWGADDEKTCALGA